MSEVIIKPCPFCGRQPHLVEKINSNETFEYALVCKNRNCITVETDYFDDQEKLLDKWNTRFKAEKKEETEKGTIIKNTKHLCNQCAHFDIMKDSEGKNVYDYCKKTNRNISSVIIGCSDFLDYRRTCLDCKYFEKITEGNLCNNNGFILGKDLDICDDFTGKTEPKKDPIRLAYTQQEFYEKLQETSNYLIARKTKNMVIVNTINKDMLSFGDFTYVYDSETLWDNFTFSDGSAIYKFTDDYFYDKE